MQHLGRKHLVISTALCGVLALSACTAVQRPATVFDPPQEGDGGIVIAQTKLIGGDTNATTITGQADDCMGPGLGIEVESSTITGKYLFDANGEPCESAATLFDGRTESGQRAADPGIVLNFRDSLGPMPETYRNRPRGASIATERQLAGLPPIPRIEVESELLDKNNPNGLSAPKPDPLVSTLASWQAQDSAMSGRSTEANNAAIRNLEAMAGRITDVQTQEQALKLAAQLRERERQLLDEQRRQNEIMENSAEHRAKISAEQEAWQQRQAQMEAELAATRQRLNQYQDLAAQLQQEKAEKEQVYQHKISTLSADLSAAEQQADASRRRLVLQAAAKIAEAEQLAHAAQLQEQDIKLREAARLKAEAETMMDRALALKVGQSVLADVEPAAAPAPMALGETPIILHAKQLTLPTLLQTILTQAEPQAGKWTADFQLSSKYQYIMDEKWSLTAEASVQQVLAQLATQIEKSHGVKLSFTRFSQSRLLVVTDDTSK